MKSFSAQPVAAKRTPQRTCIGCRQVLTKRELVRVVRTSQGSVEIDTTGKKSGRGAYVHPFRECWNAALKGTRLEHALKGRLSPESRGQLREYAANLPEGAEISGQ